MKVALCFSGMPRFLKQTHAFWCHSLLHAYDVDVFVHTWKPDCQTEQVALYQDLIRLYEPKVISLETPKKWQTRHYERVWPHQSGVSGLFSQWWGWHQVQKLRAHAQQQGSHYDVVIRARFDWFIERVQFEQNECVNVAHTPTLHTHQFVWKGHMHLGINDQFAYGKSDVMDVYGDLVHHVPDLYAQGVDMCSELLLKAHLLNQNVPHKEHVWNNGIVRDWGILP